MNKELLKKINKNRRGFKAFINKTYQDLLIKGLIVKLNPFLRPLQQLLLSLWYPNQNK